MANGFEILGQDQLDRNGNPIASQKPNTGFEILGSSGPAALDDLRIFRTQLGAPDPDEFDFRITPDIDPEERRARLQTAGSKWLNATAKMGVLTGTTFFDNTVGTIAGIGNAGAEMLAGGDARDVLNAFVDNPVSASLYDFTKKAEEYFPNYYTRKEQHSPWYNNLGTANFWADTILKNTGFAVGAYLSGMGISAGIGGLTRGMTKKLQKNIAGRMAKKMEQSEDEILKLIQAGELPPETILKELSKDAAMLRGINIGTQLTASTLGAVGESRIEALHTYHDVLDRIKRENPGMPPEKANEMAMSASNNVFLLDLVTLSMGNMAQFRNAFSRGYETNKRGINAIQRSADDALYKATGGRLEKARNLASIALNPLYEGAEEQMQFFNQNFSEKYMELQNDPDARMSVENIIEATMTAGAEALNPTNLDNFVAGAITGAMGMPGVKTEKGKTSFQWQGGIYEGVQEYRTVKRNTEQVIAKLNEYMADPEYQKRLAFLTRDASLERIKNIALANEDLYNYKNAEDDQFLNMVTAFADAGKLEDLKEDLKGLASIKPEDYRKMMAINKEQVPKAIRDEMSEDQDTYDPFQDVSDTKISNMLSERSTIMLEQVESMLKIRDDLEIKTGNDIDRSLVPTLLHYAYTIERGQKRLSDIKSNVLSELSKAFTTPMQYEAQREVYGYVYDKPADLPTGVTGKKKLKIIETGDNVVSESQLSEEEKKALNEKQKEADEFRKTQVTSKREKPDTKGMELFNFTILEAGDESMFLEAFENFAKQNPYAAEKVKKDVYDAVKLSKRIRQFVENYTEVYREGKLKDSSLMNIKESEKRLQNYIREKLRENFMPGTRVLYKDPKTKRDTVYEIVKYEIKEGKRTYILQEYVEGVGKDPSNKRIVNEDILLDLDKKGLYEVLPGQPNLQRVTLDEKEIGTDELKLVDNPEGRKVTYTSKDGKQTFTREAAVTGNKREYKNLNGRGERLLFRFFNIKHKDRLDKAINLLNELLPDDNTVPINAQIERIATLFYNDKAKMGYLAQIYTDKGLDAVAERLYGINNIAIRSALMDKIDQRKKTVKAMREQALNDYGGIIDLLYRDLLNSTVEEERIEKVVKQEFEKAKAAMRDATLLSLDKDLRKAKAKLTRAINKFEKAINDNNEQLADDLHAELIKWENKVKAFEESVKRLEKDIELLKSNYKKQKAKLDELKEKNAAFERAITTLETKRAKIDKGDELYPLETFLKNLENTIPEEAFMEGFRDRLYDLPDLGLTTQEKRDWLLRDEERPSEMSDELMLAKSEAEQAQAELDKLTAILSNAQINIDLNQLAPDSREIVNQEAQRLGLQPQELIFQLMTPNSFASKRAGSEVKAIAETFGDKSQLLEKAPTTEEDGKRLQELRTRAEEARQTYLEKLNQEKPLGRPDPNERKNELTSNLYKEQGLDSAPPTMSMGTMAPAGDATRPKMITELKEASKEEQKNLDKAIKKMQELLKAELAKDETKRNAKLVARLKEQQRILNEAKLSNENLDRFDGMTDLELKEAYVMLMRNRLSGLKKTREVITKTFSEKVKPKKKERTFLKRPAKGGMPGQLVLRKEDYETRMETDEEFLQRVYDEAYARRVEGLEALGISIDDAVSVSDLINLKEKQDELISGSEEKLRALDSTIKMVESLVKEMRGLLDQVEMGDTSVERTLGEKLRTAKSIKNFLSELEGERNNIIMQMALVSESLAKQRRQSLLMTELMEKAETKELLDLIRNARTTVKSTNTTTTTQTQAENKADNADGPDIPETITDAGSKVSPGNVSDADSKEASLESARPAMQDALSKSAGSDQPNNKPNPIKSQRRWFRWIEHNKDIINDLEVELFIPNANGYLVRDEDIENVPEANRGNVIYMVLTKVDEDGKRKYIAADGTLTDTFDADKNLYTPIPDPNTTTIRDRGFIESEARKRYGFAEGEGTREEVENAFKREKLALTESFNEKKSGWITAINSGSIPNPIIPITGTSNGIAKEDNNNVPSTAEEFFGHDDITVQVSTGDSMIVGGRAVKVPPGYTIAIDNKTGRHVVLKPRRLVDSEIDTVVNLLNLYASRHVQVEDGKIERYGNSAVLIDENGNDIDVKSANIFSVLNDITWWQGNNYDKQGNIINTNDATKFHFVKDSRVAGGEINVGGKVMPFLVVSEGRTMLNPEVAEEVRSFLKLKGFRQITSRRFNSKNKNQPYLHVKGVDSLGRATKTEVFPTYKKYVISDRSADEQVMARVLINKVEKPTTIEGYEDADAMFMNTYVTVDFQLKDESVKIRAEREKKSAAKTAAEQVQKKQEATMAAPTGEPNIVAPPAVDPLAGLPADDYGLGGSSLIADLVGGTFGGDESSFELNIGAAIQRSASNTDNPSTPDNDIPGIDRRAEPGKRYDRIEDPKKAEAWFKKNFPKTIEYKRVQRIVNSNGFGNFYNGIVTVLNEAPEGTTFHEAFHVVMNHFLSDAEHSAVISEFEQRENAEALIAQKKITYPDYTRVELIEEVLAEEFADYLLSEGKMKIPAPKQKSFFQKLLDFIKGFFSPATPSIQELYDKIENGYFRDAKPSSTPRNTRLFDRRFDAVSSPLTKEFVAVVDRKFFDLAATEEFRQEFNAFIAGDSSKAFVIQALYNKTKEEFTRAYNNLKAAGENTSIPIEKRVPYIRAAENYKKFLDSWDRNMNYQSERDQIKNSFIQFHKENSLSRHLTFKEFDFDEIKDAESADSGGNTWAFNSMTVSAVKSASQRLRLLMAGLPETNKGVTLRDYFEPGSDHPKANLRNTTKKSADFFVPKAMPFGKAFAIYSNLLSNTRTLEEAYKVITDPKVFANTPGAGQLIVQLRLKEFLNAENLESFSQSDLKLLSDFSAAFNLQRINPKMSLVGEKGNVTVISALQETQKTRLKSNSKTLEKLHATTGKTYSSFDQATEKIKYTGQVPTQTGYVSTDTKSINGGLSQMERDMLAVYASVGIEITPEIWNALPRGVDAKTVNLQNINRIRNQMAAKKISIHDKSSGFGPMLNEIYQELIEADPDMSENSYVNLNNKKVYANVLNNFTSFMKNAINSVESLAELHRKYPHTKSAFLSSSLALRPGGVLFDENGIRRKGVDLEIDISGGARTDQGNISKEYDRMGPGERFAHVLAMAENNSFLFVRAADNSNERFINIGNNPLLIQGTSSELLPGYNKAEPGKNYMAFDYIKDELLYIQEVRELQRSGSNYKFSKIMEDNNTAILTSPLLRILADYGGMNESLQDLLSGSLSEDAVRTFLEDNQTQISKAVENYLDESADKLVNRAEDLKLVVPDGIGNYINKGVPGMDNGTAGNITKHALKSNMKRVASRFLVASIEQHKLFSGHPAQFVKAKQDSLGNVFDFAIDNMIKRMSGMVGPKKASMIDINWWAAIEKLYPTLGGLKRLYIDQDSGVLPLSISDNGTVQDDISDPNEILKPVIRSLVFKDMETVTSVEELISEKFPGYDELNEADAQGMVHLDTYRDMLLANSLWNLSLEKLYRWEMNGGKPVTFKYDGQTITVNKLSDLMDNSGKMPTFNPLKPQYYGPLAEEGMVMGMYKLSVYPAVPSVIKGTKLEKLNAFMQAKNAGLLVFESGNKVGTKVDRYGELTSMYNINGDIDLPVNTFDGSEGELPFQHMHYEFFGIQVATGNTRKSTTAFATQPHKQIMYEMQSSADSYRPMSFPIEGMEEANSENTRKVMKMYTALVNARLKMATDALRNRLGIKFEQGVYVIKDTKKTISAIQDLIADRDLPQEHVRSLELLITEAGRIHPLGVAMLPQRTSIERALFAVADKTAVARKMKGAGLIQVAPTGWDKIDVNREYNDGKLSASKLKFYQREDGSVSRMQVYLPHYFKEILGEVKGEELDARLKEVLGFRIPTSGLNSMDAIEIADFLPPQAGDMIVLPSEIVNKAGSDYDVDKLTVYFPHYKIEKNAEGKAVPVYLEYYTEEEIAADPEKREELLKRNTKRIINNSPILSERVNAIKEEFQKTYFDRLEGDRNNVMSDFMTDQSVQNFIQEFRMGRKDLKSVQKALNGLKRTKFLLEDINSKMSEMADDELLGSIEEVSLLKSEDYELFARNLSELASISESQPKIQELLGILNSIETFIKDQKLNGLKEEDDMLRGIAKSASEAMARKIEQATKNDVATMFDAMSIEEKNGIKATENRLSWLMQKIILSPENYDNIVQPIGSEVLSKIAEQINEIRGKSGKLDNVSKLFDLDYMLDTVERFSEGKRGVGIGSLSSVNEILIQAANWTVNKDHKVSYYDPVEEKYVTGFNPTLIVENNALVGEVIKFTGNETASGDVRSKLQILNNFINAYVDIAADPFIIDINAGIDMAPTIIMMIRAGVPVKTAFYFANQPIVVDVMKALKTDRNNLISSANGDTKKTGDIIDSVYKKYAGESNLTPADVSRFSDSELITALTPMYQRGDSFNKMQLKVLTEFLKYRAMAGELSNVISAINYDTAGNGRGTSQIYSRELDISKVKDNALFLGFDNIFSEGTYLSGFKDSVDTTSKLYRNLFPELNNALPAPFLMGQFKQYFDGINLVGDKQINAIDIVLKEMVNHMMVTLRRVQPSAPGKPSSIKPSFTETIPSLTVSDPKNNTYSVASQLKMMLNTKKFAFLKENPFVSRLQPIVNELGGDRVIMYDQPTEAEDIDDVIIGWREMFSSNDPHVRLIASRLAELSLVQDGLVGHPVGFTKYIPPEIMTSILKSTYSQYVNLEQHMKEGYNNNLLFDIILNNYHNRDMINNIKGGRTPLKVVFKVKREYIDKPEEMQAAINSGIFVWEPEILLNPKDRKMKMKRNGKIITVDLIEFWKSYVASRDPFNSLRVFSSNRNDTLLKGGYTLRGTRNPITAALPIFSQPKPLADDNDTGKEYNGTKEVKDNKDDNGNC